MYWEGGNMKKITLYLVMVLFLAAGYLFSGEYVIMQKPTGPFYNSPEGKKLVIQEKISGVEDNNYCNRLVYLESETNINSTKWGNIIFYVYPIYGMTNAWIKIDNTIYRFSGDREYGQAYLKILKDIQIIGNDKNPVFGAINLIVTNYFNGKYILAQYDDPDFHLKNSQTYLYVKYNDTYYYAIHENDYEAMVFYKDYIIFNKGDAIFYTYSTNIDPAGLTTNEEIYYRKFLFKITDNIDFFSPLVEGGIDIRDSYLTFDTNSMEVTAYLRMEAGKPFVVEKHQFDDDKGRFIQMTNVSDFKSSTNAIYTLTGDSVRMRSEAGTNGAVVAVLNKGARVKLLERSAEEVEIGGKSGHWALVEVVSPQSAAGKRGWVFDAYLKAGE
jgi:hypothetical protein